MEEQYTLYQARELYQSADYEHLLNCANKLLEENNKNAELWFYAGIAAANTLVAQEPAKALNQMRDCWKTAAGLTADAEEYSVIVRLINLSYKRLCNDVTKSTLECIGKDPGGADTYGQFFTNFRNAQLRLPIGLASIVLVETTRLQIGDREDIPLLESLPPELPYDDWKKAISQFERDFNTLAANAARTMGFMDIYH